MFILQKKTCAGAAEVGVVVVVEDGLCVTL